MRESIRLEKQSNVSHQSDNFETFFRNAHSFSLGVFTLISVMLLKPELYLGIKLAKFTWPVYLNSSPDGLIYEYPS